MRASLAVLVLAACHHPPPRGPRPPKDCTQDSAVLRLVQRCDDLHNGFSGFTIYEAVAGKHRGAMVIDAYDEAHPTQAVQWLVGNLDLTPRYPTSMWPNQCMSLVPRAQSQPVDGTVIASQTFETEAAARRAFDYYCD